MTDATSSVRESGIDPPVRAVPMSHVSLELGHLYMEDFALGPGELSAAFAALTPWVRAVSDPLFTGVPAEKLRLSTCFLIDDYFTRFSSPGEVIPAIIKAATAANLRIDYLTRESACARWQGQRPAELTLGGIVTEPSPGSTGARPPVTETGWLTNGERSPAAVQAAMGPATPWQPPRQNAARRHSIFLDIQLWSEEHGERVWSCAMLAAVWQLLRLGLLRDLGRPVAQPVAAGDPWPQDWDALPAVIQLVPAARPFTAYTTVSLLASRFLPVEAAVRTILDQFAADPRVLTEIDDRARRERVMLPREIVDRIRYTFASPGRADPP